MRFKQIGCLKDVITIESFSKRGPRARVGWEGLVVELRRRPLSPRCFSEGEDEMLVTLPSENNNEKLSPITKRAARLMKTRKDREKSVNVLDLGLRR